MTMKREQFIDGTTFKVHNSDSVYMFKTNNANGIIFNTHGVSMYRVIKMTNELIVYEVDIIGGTDSFYLFFENCTIV